MDDEITEPTHLRSIGAFGMIPEWVLQADITSTAKVVFGWMACKYASRATWTCWPGQQRLADDLRLHPNTIAAALRELIDLGALTKTSRVQGNGAPATNYYQLIFMEPTENCGYPQKSVDTYPQKIVATYPQKTVDKQEVLEPEVLEREVQAAPATKPLTTKHAALVESPIQWHRRHGSHVQELCDWMCFPQELASQFATRAGITDADILAWAREIRAAWQTAKRVPTGSMYDFWNARWTERNAQPTDGKAELYARLRESNRQREERERLKAEKEERRRIRVRAELEAMERMRQEVWDEQQRNHGK